MSALLFCEICVSTIIDDIVGGSTISTSCRILQHTYKPMVRRVRLTVQSTARIAAAAHCPLLDNVPDYVTLGDIAPEMNAHRLLAVEQRVCNSPHLSQYYIRDRPSVAILL